MLETLSTILGIPVVATLLSTVVGASLGAFLVYLFGVRREKEVKKQQAEVATKIISAEIDRNLARLDWFWAQVKRGNPNKEPPEPNSFELAIAFVRVPLAPFERDGFDSQMPFLANLPEEKKGQVFSVYDRLGRLQAVRAELVAAITTTEQGDLVKRMSEAVDGLQRSVEDMRDATEAMIPGRKPVQRFGVDRHPPVFDFFSDKLQFAGDWEKIAEQLLADGNPLRAQPVPKVQSGTSE